MSIVTQPLRTQDDTLEKAFICIMLVEKFMLNAWVILPFLFRAGIVTTAMGFTLPQFARFHQDVHWKFSTTRNLHSCFHSWSIMVTRLCTSWPRCVQSGWVLSRAGVQSIIGKMLLVHLAGLKSICMVPFNGLIRCLFKWDHQGIRYLQFHKWDFSAVLLTFCCNDATFICADEEVMFKKAFCKDRH